MLATKRFDETLRWFCIQWAVESGWCEGKKVFLADFPTEEIVPMCAIREGARVRIDYTQSRDNPVITLTPYEDECEVAEAVHTEDDFERLFKRHVASELSEWKKGLAYYRLCNAIELFHQAGESAESIKEWASRYCATLD